MFKKQFSSHSKVGNSKQQESSSEMTNVINSMFLCTPLYDKLKVKCHPDRFVNDDLLMKKADDIFKEISDNKRNYNRLKELADIAEKDLNIKL